MSFCATWVLFDSSGRSLRSQQRKRSLVSQSFLRGRVGTFQLQGDQPPSAVRSRSHVQGIPLSDTKLLWQFSNKHHHWVRDNSWVQIIIIKVIYSLAREDLLVSNNTHELSQWGKTERDREREIDKKRAREPEIRSSKWARERKRAKGKQFWSVL